MHAAPKTPSAGRPGAAPVKAAQRLLVYGALVACVAVLVWFGHATGGSPTRGVGVSPDAAPGDLGSNTIYYTGPMRGHPSMNQGEDAGADSHWYEHVPSLAKPIDVHLSDVTLSTAVGQLARQTGLNLASVEAGPQAHVSLHVRHLPVWRAMQAVADACGGRWERDQDIYTLRIQQAATPPRPHGPVKAPAI